MEPFEMEDISESERLRLITILGNSSLNVALQYKM